MAAPDWATVPKLPEPAGWMPLAASRNEADVKLIRSTNFLGDNMNPSSVLRVVATLVVLSLVACAPAPLKKLDAPMVEAEKADHVVIFLGQTEIAVDDANVSNGGGGLLGALIEMAVESAMTKNRQEAIAPLRDKLLDYQYEDRLIESIQTHLPTSLVKADASIKVVRNDDEWRAHLESVVPANVLLINTRYAFEQNFEIAYVYAAATLQHHARMPPTPKQWKKMSVSERKAAEPKLLHAGSYYSEHVPYSPFVKWKRQKGEAGYERNARAWAENNAEPVRNAFALGLEEIALLIQRDGDGQLPAGDKKNTSKALMAHVWIQPMLLKAMTLEQAGTRTLLQFGQNTHWVDNQQIVKRRK